MKHIIRVTSPALAFVGCPELEDDPASVWDPFPEVVFNKSDATVYASRREATDIAEHIRLKYKYARTKVKPALFSYL
ncbi:MAG: hypothetical protein WC533_02210 [Candidatus Pacearchaeota archaeon]